MSQESAKQTKKSWVHLELGKAAAALHTAGEQLILAGEVLAKLAEAQDHLKRAQDMAEPTVLKWEEKGERRVKPKRDALPAPLRHKIATMARNLDALVAEVKACPITADQRALREHEKVVNPKPKRRRVARKGK